MTDNAPTIIDALPPAGARADAATVAGPAPDAAAWDCGPTADDAAGLVCPALIAAIRADDAADRAARRARTMAFADAAIAAWDALASDDATAVATWASILASVD